MLNNMGSFEMKNVTVIYHWDLDLNEYRGYGYLDGNRFEIYGQDEADLKATASALLGHSSMFKMITEEFQ